MSARLAALLALPLVAACAAAATPGPTTTADISPARWASACSPDAGWDDAGPPFRIHGNSYYVGTCGITAVLVTGDEGHVLIDGGTAKGGPLVAANIEALGFKPSDVKILLHTHEHHDHVGGLAELQRLTGARLLASPAAAPVLASGKASAEDPQAESLDGFSGMRVDGQVVAGQPVRLGSLALTPIATPGHTPGALTWQWQSCDGDDCRTLVYADSLSPVSSDSYRFGDHPAYLAAYRDSIARVGALDCDTVLSPHPGASDMHARAKAGFPADPAGCRRYAETLAARLDTRLAEEAKK